MDRHHLKATNWAAMEVEQVGLTASRALDDPFQSRPLFFRQLEVIDRRHMAEAVEAVLVASKNAF